MLTVAVFDENGFALLLEQLGKVSEVAKLAAPEPISKHEARIIIFHFSFPFFFFFFFLLPLALRAYCMRRRKITNPSSLMPSNPKSMVAWSNVQRQPTHRLQHVNTHLHVTLVVVNAVRDARARGRAPARDVLLFVTAAVVAI